MRFKKTLLSLLVFTISYTTQAQYIPSYLKKAKPAVSNQTDSLSAFPGRKKLLNAIQRLDSSDLMKNASWGVMVMEASSGKVIAAHNEKLLLTPASLMKAITTGAGFIQLGANYRFTTKLLYTGQISADSVLNGNLIIEACGDPTICSYRWAQTRPETVFSHFASKIKEAGINKITGNITIDQSAFDDMQVSPNWNWGDMGNYFGAGSSALAFNENIIHFWLNSPNSVGAQTTIDSIYPHTPNVEYRNYAKTAASNTGDNVNIYSSPTGNVIELRGTIPAGRTSFLIKGANFKPEITFANEFIRFLNSNGIHTTQEVKQIDFRAIPDTSIHPILITNYYSPAYSVIAGFTNKVSHNMFAEAILKELGRQRFGTGSYYTGVRAIDQILAKHGITQQEIINVDGSGLSRNNLITPAFLCKFFRIMSKSNVYNNYYKSLPEAGESGTIGGMFKGTAAAHNLRAKSGSIERVRSYGGYVTNKKGKRLTFAVIVNNFNEKQSSIKNELEKLMIAIAESD